MHPGFFLIDSKPYKDLKNKNNLVQAGKQEGKEKALEPSFSQNTNNCCQSLNGSYRLCLVSSLY